MPRVPEYQPGQVRPNALPTVRQTATADGDTFGGGIGRALTQSGGAMQQAGGQVGQVALLEQEKLDEAAVKEADVKFNTARRDLLFNPETGYYGTKGKDALVRRQEVETALQKARQEVATSLANDRQRRMFERVAERRLQSELDSITRHALTERNAYLDGASKARIEDAVEDARTYYSDSDMVGRSLSIIQGEVQDMAERNGWDAAQTQQALEAARSNVHKGVIDRLLVDDPTGAAEYLRQNRKQIDGADIVALEKAVRGGVTKATAMKAADDIWRQASGGATVEDVAQGQGWESVVAAVIHKESNGDATAVSPKGAVGLMQVMPATAREVAEGLGIPYDEARLASDPAYNQQIGEAYLKQMLDRYDGSLPLALAAYNAGPANVDIWLAEIGDPRQGGMSVEDWAMRIPFPETEEYVRSVTAQVAENVKRSPSAETPPLDVLMNNAAAIADPEVRQAVEARLKFQHGVAEAARRDRERKLKDEAWNLIKEGRTPDDLTSAQLSVLGGTDINAMWSFAEKQASGRGVVTDWGLYADLRKRIVGGEDVDVTTYRDRLHETEFKQLVNLAADDNEAGRTKVRTANAMVTDALEAVGINTRSSAGKGDKEATAAFYRSFEERLRLFEEQEKREAKPEEMQSIIDALLVGGEVQGGGLWGLTDPDKRVFELEPGEVGQFVVDYDEIPPAEITKITAALERKGLPTSEDVIAQVYRDNILKKAGLQ